MKEDICIICKDSEMTKTDTAAVWQVINENKEKQGAEDGTLWYSTGDVTSFRFAVVDLDILFATI